MQTHQLLIHGHACILQYYHFLIDFTPRMMYALDAASCADQSDNGTSTLYVPGWLPDNKFLLNGPSPITMRPQFDAIFSPYRLRLILLANEAQFEGLHATKIPFISHNESLWSDQPVQWLHHFRRRMRERMGAPLVVPFVPRASQMGPIVVIKRGGGSSDQWCSGSCRRHLPEGFFDGARTFGQRRNLPVVVAELEQLELASQVGLFARASASVALHGAGEANMVFMAPGTLVVELSIHDHLLLCYRRLAKKMGLRYVLEVHPAETASRDPLMWTSDIEQVLTSHLLPV